MLPYRKNENIAAMFSFFLREKNRLTLQTLRVTLKDMIADLRSFDC